MAVSKKRGNVIVLSQRRTRRARSQLGLRGRADPLKQLDAELREIDRALASLRERKQRVLEAYRGILKTRIGA